MEPHALYVGSFVFFINVIHVHVRSFDILIGIKAFDPSFLSAFRIHNFMVQLQKKCIISMVTVLT